MNGYAEYQEYHLDWLSKVPSNWKIGPVKYCFDFVVGFTPPTANAKYFSNDKGHIWVTIGDMKSKFISDSNNYLTEKAIEDFGKNIVEEGSLLYSFKLSVGKVAFAATDFFTNEAIFSILPKVGLELRYYYYCLPIILEHNANRNIYGAKIFNQDVIKNSRLPIPPLLEQTKIANYLDHKTGIIDKLIADKERLVALLQEQRQATINEAVTGGLDADGNIRQKPASLPAAGWKDSGIEWLGAVPEDWELCKLKHLVSMKSGDSINSHDISDDAEFKVFGGNGFRGYTTKFNNEGLTILVGRQGALCGNVNYAEGKFWASEHAIVVTPKKKVDKYYFGELLRTMNLNQYSEAAAQPGLSVSKLLELYVPKISVELQIEIAEKLNQKISQIDHLILQLRIQLQNLKSYRQSLISEAVTGKIDLREWEEVEV